MFRSLLVVSGFTLLSRITGLIRDILIAKFFGVSSFTDAFYVGFRIPNLLRRIFAEGAFLQAFTPIFAKLKNENKHENARILFCSVWIILTSFLIILSFIGILGSPFIVSIIASGFKKNSELFLISVEITRIMFPYIIFISLSALSSSILNTYNQFSIPAFAPALLNISFIFAAIISPYFKQSIYVLSWSVIFGGIFQISIQLPALNKINMLPSIKFNILKAVTNSEVKKVLIKMFPSLFAILITQISIIINTNIASRIGSGSVSWLNYADRLMEFPTALLGVAVGTIILPNLVQAYSNKNIEEYSSILDWGFRLTFLLATPSAIILFFFSQPIISILFHYGKFNDYSVIMVGKALSSYGIGLIGLIFMKVLAPGFYARQDIFTPIKIVMIGLCATQISNYLLVPYFGHTALSFSIGFGACINSLMLFIILLKKKLYIPSIGWKKFLVKITIGSVILGYISHFLSQNINWISMNPILRIIIFFLCLILFIIIYFGSLYLIGFKYDFYKK